MSRFLAALILSWVSAVALGLLFTVCPDGHFDPTILRLPAVVPVALLVSTVGAIVVLPFVFWAMRTGWRNVVLFGPLLWLALAAYTLFVLPRQTVLGFLWLLALAVCGILAVGFIPARHRFRWVDRAG